MIISKNDEINGFYTGVGSRKTPAKILNQMCQLGAELAHGRYCLRSGGAMGADSSFEMGADSEKGSKEIYYASDSYPELIDFIKDYHPNFNILSDFAKKLHARNALQIFGWNFENFSDFIICWTPDGYGTNKKTRSINSGGTGTAIQIALEYDIPVFNLRRISLQDTVNEIRKIVNARKDTNNEY